MAAFLEAAWATWVLMLIAIVVSAAALYTHSSPSTTGSTNEATVTDILELIGKAALLAGTVVAALLIHQWNQDRLVRHHAWQKRVQARIAVEREKTRERLSDLYICEQLARLPESTDAND